MALPLPFNHGLPISYTTSGNTTGENMIEAWNAFTGAGENSHQWIDTPFFHRWADVMADDGKKMALCWGQAGTYDMKPRTSQGPCPPYERRLSPATGSSGCRPLTKGSKATKARRGTNSPPKPWPSSLRTFATTDTSCP
jgi:hypothetical protein